MQRFSHDQILDEIHAFFDWSPPPLSADPSVSPKLDVPSCFYYDHLDNNLSCRKTKIFPALVPNLSLAVDRVLEDIKEQKITLTPVLVGDWFSSVENLKSESYRGRITNAYSVSQAYQSTTAQQCALVASMFLLSPKSPRWRPLIKWDEVEPGARANPGLDEAHTLYMEGYLDEDRTTGDVWDSIKPEIRSTLQRIIRQSPVLTIWENFAITPNNEELLKTLGDLSGTIHHERAEITKGISPTTNRSRFPDAKTLPWGAPMSSFSAEELLSPVDSNPMKIAGTKGLNRRSSRSRKGLTAKKATGQPVIEAPQSNETLEEHTHSITLPKQTKSKEKSLSEIMLKHVWLRAVQKDSTFMVFHCGNFERIAFRHRDSQTLYISELIDITHCKDPGYGKLHIGLYLSIMHDVLDRMQQQSEEDDTVRGKRRPKNNVSGPKIKRPRTRAFVAKLEADEIEYRKACDYLTGDATRCDLLLLRMCYGVYDSPSPSFFLRSNRSRVDKMDFESHEYLSITLTSHIAAGATGVVHGATIKFRSDDGKVRSMPVIVKFSLKREQQSRLRHEYSVYERLASLRVKGVPRAIGIFEDHNSETLALVMTHTGTCLSSLYPKTRFVVEEPQRSAFLVVMSDIHAAGIRHRDIRPENLTVDDEGRVYMIDFDMAEISPTEGAKSREVAHLIELLDGRYLPPNEFPSERTNPRSSESGSRSRGGSGSESESGGEGSSSGSHSYSSTALE